jgi:hypothetical protein
MQFFKRTYIYWFDAILASTLEATKETTLLRAAPVDALYTIRASL